MYCMISGTLDSGPQSNLDRQIVAKFKVPSVVATRERSVAYELTVCVVSVCPRHDALAERFQGRLSRCFL